MSAELEVSSDSLDEVISLFCRGEPLFKLSAAQAFVACADDDYLSSVSYGILGIVQSLLGLVEVGVLRSAALGYDNYISSAL